MKFLSYLFVALMFSVAISCQAQTPKLGHINSADLLAAMPEVKVADSTLQAYQKSLEAQNQTMLTEYQQKVQDFQKAGDTWTDAVKEVKQQEIQDLQSRIQDFQQSAQDKLQNKKQEIYAPILKKAEDTIKQVAKDTGYSYVFDTSAGAVIYFPDTDDLMAAVKKKLGLK